MSSSDGSTTAASKVQVTSEQSEVSSRVHETSIISTGFSFMSAVNIPSSEAFAGSKKGTVKEVFRSFIPSSNSNLSRVSLAVGSGKIGHSEVQGKTLNSEEQKKIEGTVMKFCAHSILSKNYQKSKLPAENRCIEITL